ncbi:DNA polymerase [Peribacillus acanthi]|uniref:DNA polymerase n=1 Tax=Peribacillus acanthi TaxID=2171554 RepID=UPI001473D4AB|nr:DNA polymerase [Peribacillus acanthi]
MVLNTIKKDYDLKKVGSNIQLIPKVLGYLPDQAMLYQLRRLQQHKVNTVYLLNQHAPPATIVAVDIETSSKHFLNGEIRLISVYSEQGSIVTTEVAEVANILADNKVLKVFHNAAFDVTWLKAKGLNVRNYTDTMVMSQIIRNTTKSTNSLQALSLEYFGIILDKQLQNESNWQGVLTEAHKTYALRDAEITLKLYHRLYQVIQEKCLDVVLNREIRALPAIIEMNVNGIPFDFQGWKTILEDMSREKEEIEQEILDFFASPNLNLSSPKQLREAFGTIGINLPSTKEEDLAKYEAEHLMIGRLCKYKRLNKRISTFGEKLREKIHCDGRVYGNWRLIGTNTSRMSCKEPNLQGLPSQAKQFVKAPKSCQFVIADYSTIELRILAEITQDQELISAFINGEDLHKKTARVIFNYNEEHEVTSEERQIGKVVNFGLIYGMTAYGLQKKITAATGVLISLEQAEIFRNRYFDLYKSVLNYQDRMLKADIISTLGGRYWSKETSMLKGGAIARYNYPVQGTGAEGLKEALATLMQHMQPNWKLIAAIHDEIVLQVPHQDVGKAQKLLVKVMTEGMQTLIPSIPIDIDIKTATHWTK